MQPKIILLTISTVLLIGLTVFFVWQREIASKRHNLILSESENSQQANISLPVFSPKVEPNYFPIRDFNIPDPDISARAAILYDRKSGRFLFEANINEHLPIASITKLMTAVIVFEKLDLNRIVNVPVESLNVDGSGADLYADEKLYVSDLLKMLLIESSNDAALVLAGRAKERGIDFVLEMNKKALELGMINTRFNDPAGLNDEAFSTASDLIKLVNYTRKYGILWDIMGTKSLDIASIDGKLKHHLVSTNKLFGDVSPIIGGKTGFTDGAGQTMMLLVSHEGSELLTIILGTEDRFGETEKLLDWAQLAHRWQ